jgi:phage terminase large subunit
MKLKVDKRFFNRAFWVITNAVARFVVIRGGSNSSKSWSNYQALVLWLLQGNENAIVFRKQGSTLRNSVYENLKLVAKQLKIDHLFEYYYSGDKREVVCKVGGNRIVMSGLDEPDKLKSIVGIKRVVLEEADAFTIDDFKELVRRFRGVSGIQFFFIFNPVSEKHWLKEILFDTPQYAERAEHHVFTIDDNRFAADDYAELEALREIDEDQYRIYRWGEWGIIRAQNPYLLHLKRPINGRKVVDNEEEGVIFSFDFNIKNSVTVWQKWLDEDDQWHVRCLREIRMGGTEDIDLEAICQILAQDYGDREISFSGDSSGNSRSALTKGNAEAFKIVYSYLMKHGCEFLTYNKLQSNPRRKKSRFVTNAITKELAANFAIDEGCTELWADIVAIPCDAEGDLDKDFCDDNDVGHLLDTLRYFVWAFCFDIWLDVKKNIAVPKEFRVDDNNVKKNAA